LRVKNNFKKILVMTLHEKADKLLSAREDLYEMHFHQVDREWLIEAMVDFSMQLPKKELSDEDIREGAEKWVFETNGHKWSNNNDEAGDNYGSFMEGVKWYREQLKNKKD
jgi:hypothetical protein